MGFEIGRLIDDYIIRRTAVDFAIPLFTNVRLGRRFVETLLRKSLADLPLAHLLRSRDPGFHARGDSDYGGSVCTAVLSADGKSLTKGAWKETEGLSSEKKKRLVSEGEWSATRIKYRPRCPELSFSGGVAATRGRP